MESMSKQPAEPASEFSRPESLGYLAWRLAHLFERALDKRLLHHGVNIGQFRILLILWEMRQVTQNQIANYLNIAQPTVANTLKRMERDGLIAMATDPQDGRRLILTLTAKGRRLQQPLTTEAQYVNRVATEGMPAREIERIRHLLSQLGDTREAKG
jgi:DNA-binding MarR family transcriptional regulator